MSLLESLFREESWNEFFTYRRERDQLSRAEIKELTLFLQERRYEKYKDNLVFDYPEKKIITKIGSSKKRTVYSYSSDETWMLKLLTYLLFKYDDRMSDACYSFRRHRSVRQALDSIKKIPNLAERHVLKVDIRDYFNSIDVDLLINDLKEVIDDDPEVVSFLVGLLKQDRCMFRGEIIEENRGAMAGVPLASFFANIYLTEMDGFFLARGIPYYRYSDDIIVFCDSREELDRAYEMILSFLKKRKLEINPDKVMITGPHESWEFLGIRFVEGQFDLSEVTIMKMKAKIRRKARALWRWRSRKNRSFEQAARKMIQHFDYRLYDMTGTNAFNWTRWYFPVITVSDGLHEIDECMVRYLRYLYSGRHYKGNYAIEYEKLKRLGYTSLVNEYYTWKKDNELLNRLNSGCHEEG